MAFRTGRLTAAYFKTRHLSEPTTGFVADKLMVGSNNTSIFSVDSETGRAIAVGFQDFHTNHALAMLEHLEGDEALLVVTQYDWESWKRLNPGLDVGAEDQLKFEVALSTAASMAYCLVTSGGIYLLDRASDFVAHPQIEHLRRRAELLEILS